VDDAGEKERGGLGRGVESERHKSDESEVLQGVYECMTVP
jgi:hypothetical protein